MWSAPWTVGMRGRLAGLGIGLLLLAGCKESVTRTSYDKLQVGMPYATVVDILGEPASCRALLQARSCQWGKDAKTISVQFVGDKVVLFSNTGL